MCLSTAGLIARPAVKRIFLSASFRRACVNLAASIDSIASEYCYPSLIHLSGEAEAANSVVMVFHVSDSEPEPHTAETEKGFPTFGLTI